MPARGGPVVAETVNDTEAEPLPGADDMEIHGTSADALHVHNGLDATTPMVPLPPAMREGRAWLGQRDDAIGAGLGHFRALIVERERSRDVRRDPGWQPPGNQRSPRLDHSEDS